jgi:DNA-binding PadR family transcriptional regulator
MDVKTLCLGVLSRGEATGYEIRKQLSEGPFSHFWEAGYGSIYPALNWLSERGLVHGTAMEQDKRPGKKVYAITQKGRLALHDDLMQPPARDRVRSDFCFITFFGHLLPARRLGALIADRTAWLRTTLARMEECAAGLEGRPDGERFVHGLGLAVYRAELAYLEDQGHVIVAAALRKERPAAE